MYVHISVHVWDQGPEEGIWCPSLTFCLIPLVESLSEPRVLIFLARLAASKSQ